MGLFSGIASAVGNIAGGLIDRSESRHSAKQQFKYNQRLQQQNIDFEREMAQNAHQYEIQDLEKAGLNPILSSQGSSASSIAGSSAPQGTSAGTQSNNFGTTANKIAEIMQMNSAKLLNEANAKLANSTANKTDIESGLLPKETQAKIRNLDKNSAKMEAETRKNEAEIGLIQSQEKLTQEQTTTLFWQGMSYEQQAIAQRMQNEITNKDVEIMHKYGVTRKELVELGKQALGEVVGLIKAGKYAKVAEMVKKETRKK